MKAAVLVMVQLVNVMQLVNAPSGSPGMTGTPAKVAALSFQSPFSKGMASSGGIAAGLAIAAAWKSKRRKVSPLAPVVASDSEDFADSEDDAGSDYDDDRGFDDDASGVQALPKAAGKLWTKVQFPEGVLGQANYDMANLVAAQAWNCPCFDRNCLSKTRITLLQIYEHRKSFQTTAKNDGGKRDAARASMAHHYSTATRKLSRSFVVGPLNDCCAASAGLACGLAFGTWALARADLKGVDTPKSRIDRRSIKCKVESEERRHLEAVIIELRSTMEGSKGKASTGKWFTGKRPLPQRWDDYKKSRLEKGLPVLGSLRLWQQIWKEHTEIQQVSATGHDVCDTCGAYQTERDGYDGRTDAHAVSKRAEIDERQAVHDKEHIGERRYADNIWLKAETYPDRITALNMDAPTCDEFDVPVQPRSSRDAVKSLEGKQKWSSKITGVMTAGYGILAYITRVGLGSGPNLSLTLLYLTLVRLAASPRGLGARFSLLVDGTASDNKNNEMIFFICWLVERDFFVDASFFVMIKGHTFTILDQSFNTMISQCMTVAIYTMSSLLAYMFKFLTPYNCLDVIELHHLWDWKAFFAPHITTRMGGFCTSQYGAGMHEFYARKDAEGVVRVHLRASSQASSWLPEGGGMQVFTSCPTGTPPLALAKPDTAWGRLGVEGTVRAWFKYMTFEDPAHSNRIRMEWESRFSSLPIGGDTNLLLAEHKLTWVDLPCHRSEQRPVTVAGDCSRYGVTGALENPRVNPITGFGRTSVDVERDLASLKEGVRATATAQVPALFQADYLFVQLPGCDLALHRVVHGLVIDDAKEPGLRFTSAEYVHTPLPKVLGLWGTFAPMLNLAYDPRDPKKGTMYIRHQDLDRSVIKLYHVQTFITKEKVAGGSRPTAVLRVKASSLDLLSRICPNLPMPSKIPSSHVFTATQVKSAPRAPGPSCQRGEDSSDCGDSEGEEDQDVPPPIPDGFVESEWKAGDPIKHFMVWSSLDRADACWHSGVVTRQLSGKHKSWTHDAMLDGDRGVRGVTLNADVHAIGCWVLLVAVDM